MDKIFMKEPIITNNSTSHDKAKEAATAPTAMVVDNVANLGQNTRLTCRTVRIGSYKYVPQEDIVISGSGMSLSVPLLEDGSFISHFGRCCYWGRHALKPPFFTDKQYVPLEVKFKDIVKVLVHFGKSMPVLFFYTSTMSGAEIRELLGMQDPKGFYYDPAGKDHTHKRISLLPEVICEESRIFLKAAFEGKLEELNSKEANEILVRASPIDVS